MNKLLYWSDDYRPQDFINKPHPDASKVVAILQNYDRRIPWKGWARCRICDEILGSSCIILGDFMWPKQAEHYILKHNLWIPEFDELLEKLDGKIGKRTKRPIPDRPDFRRRTRSRNLRRLLKG